MYTCFVRFAMRAWLIVHMHRRPRQGIHGQHVALRMARQDVNLAFASFACGTKVLPVTEVAQPNQTRIHFQSHVRTVVDEIDAIDSMAISATCYGTLCRIASSAPTSLLRAYRSNVLWPERRHRQHARQHRRPRRRGHWYLGGARSDGASAFLLRERGRGCAISTGEGGLYA